MPAFEFQTSGSSIQTIYTYSQFSSHRPSLPTPSPGEIDGFVYVAHVRIAAGDNAVSEPRIAMQRVRALLTYEGGLTLVGQELVESLNSFLVLSVAISGGNILVRVDPVDSSTWYIRGSLGLAAYSFRRP